ncbi:Long-chain fatty acid transport protein [Rubellimicrobium thermophilum DSM 16684]|uniref:Long-chain fatty acid transport protein n=1 Tax=Rubellimicrobium thermophilum DSM 16684 TaxID=1123069 RepID=S9S7B1_9RHOB|nr:Long-chain fatty acid transport protein [Rubellimicrobium thermophilum DSM 16684]
MLRIWLGAPTWLALSASSVLAGALDRSAQPVSALFEPGNYVELSFGYTMPTVEGTHSTPFGTSRSGNAAEAFGQGVVSGKFDVNEQLSFAVIYDQPFGADADYGDADPTYPIAGSRASFESSGITALGRYRLNDNFSIHAGARMVQVDADLFVRSIAAITATGPVFATYEASFDPDRDIGFVVGAAYEKPEIALRVALTYSSELSFENDYRYTVSSPLGTMSGTGTTRYTMPRSINLDFRTGIAANTLLFGSIRWAEWSETVIELDNYLTGRLSDGPPRRGL